MLLELNCFVSNPSELPREFIKTTRIANKFVDGTLVEYALMRRKTKVSDC